MLSTPHPPHPWFLKPAFLVAEAMVVESGCFGCWIRLFWLLNPALLVAEALVVECFGCWFRLCWLLKLWLLNPSLWLLNPAFWLLNLSCWIRVGCWIRFCSTRNHWKNTAIRDVANISRTCSYTAIRDVANISRTCSFFLVTLHACGSPFCWLDTSTLLFNSAYCRKLDF